ncbi:hypothetical protein PQ459_07540 [Chryseobacterium sp. KACC 21268]|nr:hypothetical protein PQ459_07540 [Chryseobacterium sp. KACC 21268]
MIKKTQKNDRKYDSKRIMEKGNHIFNKLDRYIGIPVLFILGFFKRKTVLPNIIKRIAILNLGSNDHSHEKHEIDNYRALINSLHIANSNNPQLINKKFDLSRLGLNTSKKIAIFHPWLGRLKKLDEQWSNDNWKDLYFNISKDFNPAFNWCSTLRN